MMKDELDHKRRLELAQVTKVPTASQGKHNVRICIHNDQLDRNICFVIVVLLLYNIY